MFQQVHRLFGLGAMGFFYQAVGLDATFVQTDNLEGASAADGHQVGGDVLVARVGYLVAQNVGFEEEELAVFGFQGNLARGQALLCFHVAVHFVVEAALQLGTLSGKLLRVQ